MSARPSTESFGAWMRLCRRRLDLTQSQLGERVGCSASAIRKIEADERKPSLQLAELLARALEIADSEKEAFLQLARGTFKDEVRVSFVAARSPLNNLPAPLTSTIDRVRDLAEVSALITSPDARLITLIGSPGIGKTRLSVQCGNRLSNVFPDGVWFVDLTEISSAEFFVPQAARAMGLFESASNLSQFTGEIREKNLLLILDNFEHVVEGAAFQVAELLKGCPKVKIIVTSRTPLRIYGEYEYSLPPLAVPPRDAETDLKTLARFEAVELFAARMKQHQPKFSVTTENARDVVEVCNILEGIPLALELAAATAREMSLAEMASMLKGANWLGQIGASARDLPHRQRTLENVIGWSYDLLNEGQRTFFCKLGVFSNWFDLNAASAICEATTSKTLESLDLLTDHSLLIRDVVKGEKRWRMLEIIREYALSRLEAAQRSGLEILRARYFLKRIQDAPDAERENVFQTNLGDFHDALRWTIAEGQLELGFQYVSALEGVWSSLGYFKEGLAMTRQLLALPGDMEPFVRAERLQIASDLAWQQYDFETSLAYIKEAVELGRAHNLRGHYAWYLNRMGRVYIEQEKYAEAKEVLSECLELARQDSSSINAGSPLAQLGEVALFEGKLEEAKRLFENALTRLTENEGIFLAVVYTDLAEIALESGEYEQARLWLGRAFEFAKRHARRTAVFLSATAGWLALASTHKEDARKAARFYGAIESIREKSGVGFTSFYRELNQKRMRLVQNKIAGAQWGEAFEIGKRWGKDETLKRAKRELGV